ncbi:MAG: tetratricopeptide repeat protein [Bacteroidota bacterium]
MCKKVFFVAISILFCVTFLSPALAQPPTWTINLLDSTKRSDKFAERKLGSEKMAEKKFNLYRRVVQNNFTHFNYYYNANNKINLVLERAKEAQKDDYSKLIPYYPYSLENTASQKSELDSVILKATAGILLHDLRNDWIDNMYLLMGKAYFLKKDFDTAAATFQFINYNLFPRKKGEDGSRIVGSREETEGNRISIANKEKQNVFQKAIAQPPSRNDALVWMVRTLIEQNELFDAASLITTLQNDPNLPKRLQDDLNDINGYWFYTQGIYDSAAVYLERGLTNAENKHDLARAEFLVAQLYELTGKYDKASEYYDKASVHTTDALMDIHAQMNNAKMRKGKDDKELDEGISNLIKLSKKDKFENYRDVLFYSAGDLAMQKPDTSMAIDLFNKSLKFNENNITYKNKAFLQLAEIAYTRKKYVESFNMYDSLQSGDTTLKDQLDKIQARRNALSKIVEKIIVIEREDSLQRIAAMDVAAREAFVKKIAKKLRKERGLKEEDNSASTDLITFDKDNDQPRDLFSSNEKSSGEWYFYNGSLKSKGFNDFKKKWGVRTNTDNWRRKAAAGDKGRAPDKDIGVIGSMNPDDIDTPTPAPLSPDAKDAGPTSGNKFDKNGKKQRGNAGAGDDSQPEDISFEGLMSNLPLNEEKMAISNALLAENLFELGKLFQQELEDYGEAINTYNESLRRFPDSTYDGEIYFNLSYCYSKLGMNDRAEQYKKMVKQNFAGGKADKMMEQLNAAKTGVKNPEATKRYEDIYNLFIEGRFDSAVAEKQKADSLYGKSFWTPQLLYIEAVYHVKQKDDSAAINVLGNIVSLYPKAPLKAKAERMIEVLGRRKEIEEYLTNLQVTRIPEDSVVEVNNRKAMVRNDSALIVSPKFNDSVIRKEALVAKNDSATKQLTYEPLVSGPYTLNLTVPHFVIMVFDKVDITYINESKNALGRYATDNFRGAGISVAKDTVNKENALLIFSLFPNADEALIFLTKIQKAAPEEISWLPPNKYSFLLIDEENLQRMKNTKDISGYRNLLMRQYPGKIK